MGVLVSKKMSAKNWEDMEIASGHDDSPSGGSKFGKLGCCIGGLFVLWLFCSIRIVPPAHSGLVVTFGSVKDSTLTSGMHLVHPLASVVSINLKTQALASPCVSSASVYAHFGVYSWCTAKITFQLKKD